MDGQADGRTD